MRVCGTIIAYSVQCMNVHIYVENATEKVSSQSEGRREQHQELMEDLGKLKDKAKQVWDKMGQWVPFLIPLLCLP